MMSVLYLFTYSQDTDRDTDKRDTFHWFIQALDMKDVTDFMVWL